MTARTESTDLEEVGRIMKDKVCLPYFGFGVGELAQF